MKKNVIKIIMALLTSIQILFLITACDTIFKNDTNSTDQNDSEKDEHNDVENNDQDENEKDVEYKIGDTGPAGGIIFYKRENITNDWQYLEAAPVDTEFADKQFGAYGTEIGTTQLIIGSGLKNTDNIISILVQLGDDDDRAAVLCKNLIYNGYDDWFLPSRDELQLIYDNLVAKGLGDYSKDDYLTSSETPGYTKEWAYCIDFSDGSDYGNYGKDDPTKVRAVRSF